MLLRDKDKPMAARVLMILSAVSVALAIVGAVGRDYFLASTQWLIVATTLAIWGVYLLLEAEFRS